MYEWIACVLMYNLIKNIPLWKELPFFQLLIGQNHLDFLGSAPGKEEKTHIHFLGLFIAFY